MKLRREDDLILRLLDREIAAGRRRIESHLYFGHSVTPRNVTNALKRLDSAHLITWTGTEDDRSPYDMRPCRLPGEREVSVVELN